MGNSTSQQDGSGPIDISSFKQNQIIGKGGFGVVRMVTKRDTKKVYALKYIDKRKCIDKGSVRNIFRERIILAKCAHPFIINLQFAFQDDNFMFMVLDLAQGGDLRFHLARIGILPEQTVRLYAAEVSAALHYLHSNQILHRDLKPENLLLDGEGHCCITDFNVAIMLDEKIPTSKSGTTAYMAPEMFHKKPYRFSVDWWSLGCVLYECTYSVHPLFSDRRTAIESAIQKGVINFPPLAAINQETYRLTDSPTRTAFLRGLLTRSLPDRLGHNGFVADIVSHPWMSGINWPALLRRELVPQFTPDPTQQNYDFGAALEELMFEGSPLPKKPVRKRHLRKNREERPALALLWNDDGGRSGSRGALVKSSSRKKLEEELDYIEEFFEDYTKAPQVGTRYDYVGGAGPSLSAQGSSGSSSASGSVSSGPGGLNSPGEGARMALSPVPNGTRPSLESNRIGTVGVIMPRTSPHESNRMPPPTPVIPIRTRLSPGAAPLTGVEPRSPRLEASAVLEVRSPRADTYATILPQTNLLQSEVKLQVSSIATRNKPLVNQVLLPANSYAAQNAPASNQQSLLVHSYGTDANLPANSYARDNLLHQFNPLSPQLKPQPQNGSDRQNTPVNSGKAPVNILENRRRDRNNRDDSEFSVSPKMSPMSSKKAKAPPKSATQSAVGPLDISDGKFDDLDLVFPEKEWPDYLIKPQE